tara:strand:+ start:44 stop:547 length:504 start_codon:yes stop_codon:yes gene_type:complete
MTTTITGATGIDNIRAATGAVIQVVDSSTTTQVSNTGTSFTSTGLSVVLTPKSASSKIIVMVNQVIQTTNTSNYATGRWKIVKTQGGTTSDITTVISTTNGNVFTYDYGGSGVNRFAPLYLQGIETSGSTTERTYFTQIAKGSNGGSSISSQPESALATIVVMEVAG